MTSRTLVALIVALSLAFSADAAGRRRAVRVPAPDCSFLLSTNAIVARAEGVSRLEIGVLPVGQPCTTWAAFSPVDWIGVEAAPSASRAYLSIAANPATEPRTAVVTIAGLAFDVTQEGDIAVVTPPDPNVLRNSTFDSDISQWGWDPRFPNGSGSASWSNLDANGSSVSGSFKLRSTGSTPAFQQLQCVAVTGGRSWRWGGAVLLAAPTGGAAYMVLVEYATDDCSGNYTKVTKPISGKSDWQRPRYLTSLQPATRSVHFLVASSMTGGQPFEAWFDDLFLQLP